MVTLALIQGVLNTFVIFLSRVIGYVVDRVVLKNERGYGPGYWVTTIVAEIVLGIVAAMIVAWFSRGANSARTRAVPRSPAATR